MSITSIIFLFILISSTSSTSQKRKQNFDPYFRFKSINCSSSFITLSSFKCFIKAYSRRNTTLNVYMNITKPLFKANVIFDLKYKSISNSQRSIINITTEGCSIVNGTVTNKLFNWLIGNIPLLKRIIHACPYEVCI